MEEAGVHTGESPKLVHEVSQRSVVTRVTGQSGKRGAKSGAGATAGVGRGAGRGARPSTVLGVEVHATETELKKAYRQLAVQVCAVH